MFRQKILILTGVKISLAYCKNLNKSTFLHRYTRPTKYVLLTESLSDCSVTYTYPKTLVVLVQITYNVCTAEKLFA